MLIQLAPFRKKSRNITEYISTHIYLGMPKDGYHYLSGFVFQ